MKKILDTPHPATYPPFEKKNHDAPGLEKFGSPLVLSNIFANF